MTFYHLSLSGVKHRLIEYNLDSFLTACNNGQYNSSTDYVYINKLEAIDHLLRLNKPKRLVCSNAVICLPPPSNTVASQQYLTSSLHTTWLRIRSHFYLLFILGAAAAVVQALELLPAATGQNILARARALDPELAAAAAAA